MKAAKADPTEAESMPLSDQNGNLKSKDSSLDQEGTVKSHSSPPETEQKAATAQLGWNVWLIFAGLAVSALLSALEGSVVSTALPTIAADLGLGGNYVWVINIYFLTR